jgi:hypothetical protein
MEEPDLRRRKWRGRGRRPGFPLTAAGPRDSLGSLIPTIEDALAAPSLVPNDRALLASGKSKITRTGPMRPGASTPASRGS